jgi:hypothetical protein
MKMTTEYNNLNDTDRLCTLSLGIADSGSDLDTYLSARMKMTTEEGKDVWKIYILLV